MRAIFVISLCLLLSPLYAQKINKVLIWSEEFDYSGLPNPEKWDYDAGGSGFGNNELQYYTKDRLENARVDNGKLIIEARKENYSGKKFTSARIKTLGNGDWKYGRFEVKAKLPTGKGIWPAIWFLPSESVYGNWPSSGEIDLMESVGYDPDKVFFTTHTETYNHKTVGGRGSSTELVAPYDNFYTYALEWYADSLRFYVNDVLYYSLDRKPTDTYKEWPFDQKMHLILNNAVGGDWAGSQGIDSTIFPQKFEVDFVRVYQFSEEKSEYDLLVQQVAGGTVNASFPNGKVPANSDLTVEAVPAPGYEFIKWEGTYQDLDNPLQFNMAVNTTIKPIFRKKGEMIQNGQFDAGFFRWSQTVPSSLASSTIDQGEIVYNISKSGTNAWDIQFSQDGLLVEKGNSYTLTFDVWASQQTSFTASVGMSKDPWTVYSGATQTAGSTKKTVTYTFTMSAATDPEARIIFDLGKALGSLHFDNVSLVKNNVLSTFNPLVKSKVSVYPNPSADKILVESDVLMRNITIYNQSGMIVFDQKNTRDYKIEIATAGLQKGVYILEIETGEGIIKEKVIKE
ncbi:family 16 glycosylhydrolase [Sporocytophaga myxococcoides]|uniref:family 16 glycosylhydrolase n=1 Tax=Sporocytophaga myxococcoides TaxID=153721 RepID=UPI00040A12BF|nr:family 16 glycosylhydrolase [Sporocytophaga myxococcoides]